MCVCVCVCDSLTVSDLSFVCSIGYAMDALHRLQLRSSVRASAKRALEHAHSQLTVRCPGTFSQLLSPPPLLSVSPTVSDSIFLVETLARTQPEGFDLWSPELWPQIAQ